jgi:hypothetical protein
MKKKHIKTSILLSCQVALTTVVSSTLRQVWVDWDDREIFLYFIFDGPIDDDLADDAECVATEVISDFSEFELIDTKYIQIDFPREITPYGKFCVYARKEEGVKSHFRKFLDLAEINSIDLEEIYKRRISVLLSCLQSFLGSITSTMRKIYVDWDETTIWLYFVFDGPITEEMQNEVTHIAKKITVDFPPPEFAVHPKCLRIDFPERVSLQAKQCIFERKETFPD